MNNITNVGSADFQILGCTTFNNQEERRIDYTLNVASNFATFDLPVSREILNKFISENPKKLRMDISFVS